MGGEISHEISVSLNNGFPKKGFAEIELEKKIKQIFAISD
jgi:hypothetical protein